MWLDTTSSTPQPAAAFTESGPESPMALPTPYG
jgi:hypothetical protein